MDTVVAAIVAMLKFMIFSMLSTCFNLNQDHQFIFYKVTSIICQITIFAVFVHICSQKVLNLEYYYW